MKYFFAIALLLVTGFSSTAQDKKALEASITKMYQVTVDADFETLMDYTYPKIFEIAPREQLMQAMKGMLNGPEFNVTVLTTPPNFEYGPIKKIGGGSYCVVQHDLLMKMAFKEPVNDEGQKAMIESFKTTLKASMVTFDAKENAFTVKKRTEVIAVADKLTNNQWKFLNTGADALMEKMLGKEVVNQLGL